MTFTLTYFNLSLQNLAITIVIIILILILILKLMLCNSQSHLQDTLAVRPVSRPYFLPFCI